jgi:hypothetical protein
MRLKLVPHPDTPFPALRGIEVEVTRRASGGLELHYFVMGAIREVAWPEVCPSARSERLWEHTCFEAFVSEAGRADYHEINLSPSTCWAAYRFMGYRTGMQVARGVATTDMRSRVTSTTHVLRAQVPLTGLPGLSETAPWTLGLSAVIEARDGTKSYWALKHPLGKPDFHHPDCFALTLAPPGNP